MLDFFPGNSCQLLFLGEVLANQLVRALVPGLYSVFRFSLARQITTEKRSFPRDESEILQSAGKTRQLLSACQDRLWFIPNVD